MNYRQVCKFTSIGTILTFAITSVMVVKGVTLTPDSWAYWEGSVSLMYGKGYEYFGGQNITAFPPFFSVMLSFLQSATGISGFSLFIYLVIISGVNSFIWIYLFSKLNKGELTISNIIFVVYFYFVRLEEDTIFS